MSHLGRSFRLVVAVNMVGGSLLAQEPTQQVLQRDMQFSFPYQPEEAATAPAAPGTAPSYTSGQTFDAVATQNESKPAAEEVADADTEADGAEAAEAEEEE